MVAPTTPPSRLPAPPTMVIIRYSMPMLASKGPGLMKRLIWAYSHPESEARKAAITNVKSFILNALMPRLSTRMLPPRRARMARPTRESSRL